MRPFSRSTFIRSGLLMVCSALAAALYSPKAKSQNASEATPGSDRLKTLSKGFNLEHWRRTAPTDGFYTQKTLQQYRRLGLTYTRLPVVLSKSLDDSRSSVTKTDFLRSLDNVLEPSFLSTLDEIIEMHVQAELGIILAPFGHPPELYTDPELTARFADFWKALATHLSSTNPEKVFLQVMNEPAAETPQAWDPVQLELIQAIRSGAPNHTIIASANLRVAPKEWSQVRALPLGQVVADQDLVYDFHFYEPITFTHQGATWGADTWQFMKDVPYPATPAAVAPILAGIQNPKAKAEVEDYGAENWNQEKVARSLSTVTSWARNQGVRIICSEFGVYPQSAPRASRLRYLKDVREVLEFYGIGWGHWFRLDVFDDEVMQALGLTPLTRL